MSFLRRSWLLEGILGKNPTTKQCLTQRLMQSRKFFFPNIKFSRMNVESPASVKICFLAPRVLKEMIVFGWFGALVSLVIWAFPTTSCAVKSLITLTLFWVMGLVEVLLLVYPPKLFVTFLGMWDFFEAIDLGRLETWRFLGWKKRWEVERSNWPCQKFVHKFCKAKSHNHEIA